MTATTIVINDTEPRRQYTATGGQTEFDFPLPFFNQGDLDVYLTPVGNTPDDTADLLTITTEYTVAGADTQDGGLVTLVTPATAGDVVTIERVVDIARTSDYQTSGDLLAETLNEEQDTEIMISQQLRQDINRSFKLPTSTQSSADLTIPEPVALEYLRWNAAADQLETAAGTTAPASGITFVPAGNIAATDVQAAIEELDTEKEPADATILKDADIGVTVQAFDADILKADTSDDITVGFTTNVPAATFAANFTPDVTASQMQTLPVTGALTIDEVLDGNEGVIAFKLEVDGSGPYSLNRNTNVQFKGTEVTSLAASTNYTMTVEKYDATTTVIQVLEIKSA